MTIVSSLLWRRIDLPGHEAARLLRDGPGWRMHGTAAFAHDGRAVRLDYDIRTGADWRTRSALVEGWVAAKDVRFDIAVENGRWMLNGRHVPSVDGCIDVDLGFSPSTNLLPIRRLGLAADGSAPVAAAWLRFPALDFVRLDQTYARLAENSWRYESAGGAFQRTLTVNAAGMVTDDPGLWSAVTE
jgi:hypothetical protein